MHAPTINKKVTHVNQSEESEAHIIFGIWIVFQESAYRKHLKFEERKETTCLKPEEAQGNRQRKIILL